MKLSLKRKQGQTGFTDGILRIDGFRFCETLEDQERPVKIYGATAIPKGTYKVIITYSNRFKRKMPLLLNVPNFEGIRIHSGNTASDSSGCILVGEYLTDGYVKNSRITYNKLYPRIKATLDAGKEVTIEIS